MPKPRRNSKAANILTLATQTPATPTEIAASLDTSLSNVSHTLARYGINTNSLNFYKKKRADIMAGIQEKILAKVNVDDIKITTAKEMQAALTSWGILYDKERTETGQSNVNVAQLVAHVEDLQRGEVDT